MGLAFWGGMRRGWVCLAGSLGSAKPFLFLFFEGVWGAKTSPLSPPGARPGALSTEVGAVGPQGMLEAGWPRQCQRKDPWQPGQGGRPRGPSVLPVGAGVAGGVLSLPNHGLASAKLWAHAGGAT